MEILAFPQKPSIMREASDFSRNALLLIHSGAEKITKNRSAFSAYDAYRATVLFVTDTEEGGQALDDIFGADFSVVRTEKRKKGLTVLQKNEAQIDLILVDLKTAAMSFSTFLRIKADVPKMCKIPAVVVLTENSEENKDAVLRMGAEDFLLKPFGPATVRRRVTNILQATAHAGRRRERGNAVCRLMKNQGEEKYENDLS